jgi:hypothetical protein
MPHSAELNLKIEYLREYEFIFKTALAHESGDPGVLFAEKNRGSKISWDCPFKIRVFPFSINNGTNHVFDGHDISVTLKFTHSNTSMVRTTCVC